MKNLICLLGLLLLVSCQEKTVNYHGEDHGSGGSSQPDINITIDNGNDIVNENDNDSRSDSESNNTNVNNDNDSIDNSSESDSDVDVDNENDNDNDVSNDNDNENNNVNENTFYNSPQNGSCGHCRTKKEKRTCKKKLRKKNRKVCLPSATNNHAVWFGFGNISDDFKFVGNPKYIIQGKKVVLKGTIESESDPYKAFKIKVVFTGKTNVAPVNSPKLERGQPASQYNTWTYYTDFTGTLKGLKDYAGAVIKIDPRGPAYQVGIGANNKDNEFGGSAWFYYRLIKPATTGEHIYSSNFSRQTGDINIRINCQ